MKTKLHFGVLLLFLAFLGTYIEQTTVPNQQMVVQFSDTNITLEESENAITALQEQLLTLGVTHIQIGENAQGQLKITYHSDLEITRIQQAIFNADHVNVAFHTNQHTSLPLSESHGEKQYKINISEITTSNDGNWDFNGLQIVEHNQKFDRFSYFKTHSSGLQNEQIPHNYNLQTVVVCRANTAWLRTPISDVIPEVRAGPNA